jgi:hypothetical protein
MRKHTTIKRCPRCEELARVPCDAKMCTACGGSYTWHGFDGIQFIRYAKKRTAILRRWSRGKDGKLGKAKVPRVCRKWRQRNV